ncbi:DUF4377 domain-containing protein [Pedobacter namyangjuensis]|uniref:DUF4377 domain-containing protein n=1 Tax=Pedobacter namyangjuensis TaxID=600626 RepID=UPI000DE5646F|nr:DUF4377 domain-containing protein [Pedobacter namyangjuensis]
MKSILNKLMLAFLLSISTSFIAKSNVFTLTVKEDLADCTGVGPRKCYQVKYSNSKNWEFFYSEIIGFKYESGNQYILKVSRTKRKNVPADASAYIYKLVKVVKKTRMAKVENKALNFIAKHKWNLIQLNGKTLENANAFLKFDFKEKRFSGNSGCNNLMGSFSATENTISFTKVGATRMFCNEDKNKLEQEVIKLLSDNTFTFDIADQTLNFYQKDNLVMMFGKSTMEK